jgi:DNA-binding response OmpR family regulator
MPVLLVEDYLPLQRSVAEGLREAGFAVDVTGDGEEGLWYATGGGYDGIILDIMLPGMDGLAVLKRLREEEDDTPVLILTARDAVADRVQGLNLGADDYLAKPFAFEELLARVHALVRRRYGRGSPEIVVGALRIDTAARRAWRGSRELQLTAREYTLLEYLAMRAGETVSRSDIWQHLYEFEAEATSNVVDVYIGYLRRKLEEPGEARLIRTVRGVGYALRGTA